MRLSLSLSALKFSENYQACSIDNKNQLITSGFGPELPLEIDENGLSVLPR